MLDQVRIAAIAVDAQPGDLEGNLQKVSDWTRQAASDGAQIGALS